MIHRERLEPIAVAVESLPGLELDGLEAVGETPEHTTERREELAEAARAVDRQRELASAQRVRLEHPREPEVVVGVVVRQEHVAQLEETDVGAKELSLRPLGAVDQEALSPTPHERRGRGSLGGGRGPGRPEEDDVEVHCRRF